jgi:hypothetical protein
MSVSDTLAIVREAHAGEIKALREQLADARYERDQERARAEQAEAVAAAERQQADILHQQLQAAELVAQEVAQLRWQVAEAQQAIAFSPPTDERHGAVGRLLSFLSGLRRRSTA